MPSVHSSVWPSAHFTCWPPLRRRPSNLEPFSSWKTSRCGTNSESCGVQVWNDWRSSMVIVIKTTGTSDAQPERTGLVAVPTRGQPCQLQAPDTA